MLNRQGIRRTQGAAVNQILMNVELQASIGCIVPQALGTTVGDRLIAQAGTPIFVDYTDMQEPAVAANAAGSAPGNAVLLHDVDVTAGSANGTALIFGFINLNRVADPAKTTLGTEAAGLPDSIHVITAD